MNGSIKKILGGLKVVKCKLFKQYVPFEINIHITDKCNLRCTYCYSNFYKRRIDDIPQNDIFRIVDEFKKLGSIEVSLIGGEPFLHPGISEIIEYIKSKGLFCSAVTNGYFIKNHLGAVKKLDMVCVSLDGPEEINDIARGKGSYKQAIKALEILREHRVNFSIRATLQKYNLNYVDEIVDVAERYEVILNFGLLFPQSSDDGQYKTISKDTPNDIEYKKALKKIVELKVKKPERFFNSLTNLKNALNWPTSYTRFFLYRNELKEFPYFKPIPCFGGRTFATIDTDGRLYPCTNLIGYYDAPNVLEMDIKEAWNSIGGHNCSSCFYLSSVEKNLVFNANFDAIWNLMRVKRLK